MICPYFFLPRQNNHNNIDETNFLPFSDNRVFVLYWVIYRHITSAHGEYWHWNQIYKVSYFYYEVNLMELKTKIYLLKTTKLSINLVSVLFFLNFTLLSRGVRKAIKVPNKKYLSYIAHLIRNLPNKQNFICKKLVNKLAIWFKIMPENLY